MDLHNRKGLAAQKYGTAQYKGVELTGDWPKIGLRHPSGNWDALKRRVYNMVLRHGAIGSNVT
jgi:hypothetical protein